MDAYVITLTSMPESVALAARCVDSGEKFGISVKVFDAIDRNTADQVRLDRGLSLGALAEEFADPRAVIGCFMSMFLLWEKVRDSGVSAIILEHDAVFVGSLPESSLGDVVNLGKPSFGAFNEKKVPGVYSLFSKEGGYFPGTHGYYLTPTGAEKLILTAEKEGVHAADLFLCKSRFP